MPGELGLGEAGAWAGPAADVVCASFLGVPGPCQGTLSPQGNEVWLGFGFSTGRAVHLSRVPDEGACPRGGLGWMWSWVPSGDPVPARVPQWEVVVQVEDGAGDSVSESEPVLTRRKSSQLRKPCGTKPALGAGATEAAENRKGTAVPVECPTCHKKFLSKYYLKVHNRWVPRWCSGPGQREKGQYCDAMLGSSQAPRVPGFGHGQGAPGFALAPSSPSSCDLCLGGQGLWTP